jgi:hypothetical protein
MTEQEKAVALVEPQGNSLTARMAYAKALSTASLLPADYRNHPANILMALEYGHELGIGTMTAIQQIHVIKGKPSASAQLIGSLVRKAGHRLRVTGSSTEATAIIWRKDDPDFEFKSTWTLDRAKAAGLLPAIPGSGWDKYPDAMLVARATTEVARQACAEVLAGVAYTPEELGSEVVEVENLGPATVSLSGGVVGKQPESVTTTTKKTWSSQLGIGAVMEAQAAAKEEMPTPDSPIIEEAQEVDDWGIPKVKVTNWDNSSFESAEPFVTESAGETCEHGDRRKQEGISKKSNKPYLGWHCPNKVCETVWYHQDPSTGEWVR